MSDLILLQKYMEASGKGIDEISKICGIKSRRMSALMSGKEDFKASEMMALSEVLHLTSNDSNTIFFSQEVEHNETQEG